MACAEEILELKSSARRYGRREKSLCPIHSVSVHGSPLAAANSRSYAEDREKDFPKRSLSSSGNDVVRYRL
jgi:hypothetical protein